MSLYIKIITTILSVTFAMSDFFNTPAPYSTEPKLHLIAFSDADSRKQTTIEMRQDIILYNKEMLEETLLDKNESKPSEPPSLINYKHNDALDLSTTELFHEEAGDIYDNSEIQLETENSLLENNCNFTAVETNQNIVIRKCCQANEFFSLSADECVASMTPGIFHHSMKKFTNSSFSTQSKLLKEECGNRLIALMDQNSHFSFIGNGELMDCFLGHVYNQSEYCLELVGESIDQSNLVLTYCPKRNVIPKCCGLGDYYNDSTVPECVSYGSLTGVVVDEASLLPDTENYEFGFRDLSCLDQLVWLDLNLTHFNGTSLCLSENDHCFDWDKYCIDNLMQNGTMKMMKAALICPEFMIYKCCPEGESFMDQECIKTDHRSPYLNNVLNAFKYEVMPIFNRTNVCNDITIINDTSDISWSINSEGKAVLTYDNSTIAVNNFCIEDYFYDEMLVPILKICSGEGSTFKNWFENLLGKCCPSQMVYHPQVGEVQPRCVAKRANVMSLTATEEFKRYSIKNLKISGFPNCPDSIHYHHFNLGKSVTDYAELTEDGRLNIVDMDNGCKVRETKIASAFFCLEYKVEGEQYEPHAFVCAPDNKNPHSEKTALIVTLVAISCASLTASFISLLFKKVQKGMVKKIRKMNTLAGKIQLSYVASQLIGYLVLGIISLVDFDNDHMTCLILTGLLIFFMMAAFCWNTSICLEGFLITMTHVRMSDRLRYFLHSLWAWGISGVVTALTLFRNSNENQLSCDAIKPQIGKDRCFFSDAKATLLYFYLPISITVVMNGVLLVASKFIRKTTLIKLGKGQCSIERHENVKKVLSLQNMRGFVKREGTNGLQFHSGLRTHQTKNMWIESLRLVIWSGITWLMEILGTLVTMYGGRSQGEWYNYLWYIPVGFNCLRGLGISFIISYNSETQSKISKTLCSISSDLGKSFSELKSKTIRGKNSHFIKQNTLSVVEKFKFKGSLYIRDNKPISTTNINNSYTDSLSFNEESKNGGLTDNGNQDEVVSIATILTNVSNSASSLTEMSTSKTPHFYHSVSRSDPVIVSNMLPDIHESLECSTIKEEGYLTNELESLDNTLMELTFWDEVAMKKSLEYKNSLKTNDYRIKNKKYKCAVSSNDTDESHRSSDKVTKSLGFDNNKENHVDSIISATRNAKSLNDNELTSTLKTKCRYFLNGSLFGTTCNIDIQQACHEQECICSLNCQNTYL